MASLDRETFNEVVKLLVPLLGEGDRQGIVQLAFADTNLPQMISFGGNAQAFTVLLVRKALDYGQVKPGEEALAILLETVKPNVGLVDRNRIDEIIAQLSGSTPASSSAQPASTPTPQGNTTINIGGSVTGSNVNIGGNQTFSGDTSFSQGPQPPSGGQSPQLTSTPQPPPTPAVLPWPANTRADDHIFISYSSSDRVAIVDRLADDLNTAGFKVWVDNLDARYGGIVVGEDWKQSLANAINAAGAVVFVITPDSVQSAWCAAEIKRALESRKPLVPIMVRPLKTETEKAAFGALNIGHLHYLDFFSATYQGGLQHLQAALKAYF